MTYSASCRSVTLPTIGAMPTNYALATVRRHGADQPGGRSGRIVKSRRYQFGDWDEALAWANAEADRLTRRYTKRTS
ncbi:MAG: hypothetical protein AAFQ53_14940 [Bacteroidota bacterium]